MLKLLSRIRWLEFEAWHYYYYTFLMDNWKYCVEKCVVNLLYICIVFLLSTHFKSNLNKTTLRFTLFSLSLFIFIFIFIFIQLLLLYYIYSRHLPPPYSSTILLPGFLSFSLTVIHFDFAILTDSYFPSLVVLITTNSTCLISLPGSFFKFILYNLSLR
jgi:hypothetical protein